MTTVTASPAAPDGTPSSPTHGGRHTEAFREPSAADVSARTHKILLAIALSVVAVGVHIDQELMMPAIDRAMRVGNGVAFFVSISFAMLAGAAAWTAGKDLRKLRAYGSAPTFWLSLGGFVLIGVGFFLMRLFGGSGYTSEGAADSGLGVATILAITYLAVGLVAAAESYYLCNPALTGKLRAEHRMADLAPQLQEAEAAAVEARVALETSIFRRELVHEEHEEAIRETKDLAAEVRDYARALIAAALGDPAQTGLVFDRFDLDEDREAAGREDEFGTGAIDSSSEGADEDPGSNDLGIRRLRDEPDDDPSSTEGAA
ncbi:hypothetical protein [Ruania rhizosphaerae]|uniref:hypothetical protein n=1 Tax=Ruania rhizosphaerae TaxID=1840413 RepID=UPI00135B02B0|nr:hypothetical protein [Ruania rhizosphaerae]